MNTFQDKFYRRVLRHDKKLCVGIAFGPILAAAVVGLLNFRFSTFLLIVVCTAFGACGGSLICFGLLHYLRRRYEQTVLDAQQQR